MEMKENMGLVINEHGVDLNLVIEGDMVKIEQKYTYALNKEFHDTRWVTVTAVRPDGVFLTSGCRGSHNKWSGLAFIEHISQDHLPKELFEIGV